MDAYIQNDPNNPINHERKTLCCDICGIEEHKTYFVDDTNICENCYTEEEEETKKNKMITPLSKDELLQIKLKKREWEIKAQNFIKHGTYYYN